MTITHRGFFQKWAPSYRKAGFWPRPVTRGTKATSVKGWSRPDPEIPTEELKHWIRAYPDCGIGLLMGSPLPDGTVLGGIDVDDDLYAGAVKGLLGGIVSGRFGSKGFVAFVRVSGPARSTDFRISGEQNKKLGKTVECLFKKKFCVIPPTIHPNTDRPYSWIGTPLHEVDFSKLPLIET